MHGATIRIVNFTIPSVTPASFYLIFGHKLLLIFYFQMYTAFVPSFVLGNSPVWWSLLCQPVGKSEGYLLARKKRET